MILLRPSSWFTLVAVCACSAPAYAQDGAPSFGGLSPNIVGIIPYALIFAVMYALLIRPEGKRRRAQDEMQAGLKKNDEVLTQAGFIARIVQLEDKLVTLELCDKVKVRMLRERIVGRYVPEGAVQAKPAP